MTSNSTRHSARTNPSGEDVPRTSGTFGGVGIGDPNFVRSGRMAILPRGDSDQGNAVRPGFSIEDRKTYRIPKNTTTGRTASSNSAGAYP